MTLNVQRALRHPSFVIGGIMVLLMVACAILSLFGTPYPVAEIDIPNKLAAPSSAHWFGTDSLGRDIASLLLVGSQSSLLVGFIAVGIGLGVEVPIGRMRLAITEQGKAELIPYEKDLLIRIMMWLDLLKRLRTFMDFDGYLFELAVIS